MSLALSNRALDGAKDLLKLSFDQVKRQIDSCFDYLHFCLLRKELTSELVPSSLPLCVIVTEALKQNMTDGDFKIFLTETIELSEELADYFTEQFSVKKELLRNYMQGLSVSYPEIVDCKWRLDCAVKSDTCDVIREPRYFISLTLRHNLGNLSSLTFSSSLEGLQDLVQSLRQACKSVEKAANFSV